MPVSTFLHIINELEKNSRVEVHDKKLIRHRFELTAPPSDVSALSRNIFSWLRNQMDRELARIDEVIWVKGYPVDNASL